MADSSSGEDRLSQLAEEIRYKIASELVTDDPYKTARDLAAYSSVSRKSYATVHSGSINDFYETLRQTITVANELTDAIRQRALPYPTGEEIGAHGPILGYLSPVERSDLATVADGLTQPFDKAAAVAGLSAGMKYLKPNERSALVEMVTNPDRQNALKELNDKKIAVFGVQGYTQDGLGLVGALEHLSRDERAGVVKTAVEAIGSPGSYTRESNIAALNAGIKRMEPQDRVDLHNDVPALSELIQEHTTARPATELEHLTSEELSARVKNICDATRSQESTDHLSSEEVIDKGNSNARELSILGAELDRMEPHERSALGDAMKTMSNDGIVGMIGEIPRDHGESTSAYVELIKTFASKQEHLQPEVHSALIGLACSLDDPYARDEAIGAVAAGKENLHPHNYSALVKGCNSQSTWGDHDFEQQYSVLISAGMGLKGSWEARDKWGPTQASNSKEFWKEREEGRDTRPNETLDQPARNGWSSQRPSREEVLAQRSPTGKEFFEAHDAGDSTQLGFHQALVKDFAQHITEGDGAQNGLIFTDFWKQEIENEAQIVREKAAPVQDRAQSMSVESETAGPNSVAQLSDRFGRSGIGDQSVSTGGTEAENPVRGLADRQRTYGRA